MARTEVQEVLRINPKMHREHRGMGHGYYARPSDQQPPQVDIPRRSDIRDPKKLTLSEGREIFEQRQQFGVSPRDLEVQRVQIITRRRKQGITTEEQVVPLDREQERIVVERFPEVAGAVIGQQMYKDTRKEEKKERKALGKGPNFFWGLMLAKAFDRPEPTLKRVAAGLISEKSDPVAMNQIQDAVRAAIQVNFPEFRSRAVHEANGIVKFLRWGPLPYVTSLFSFIALDAIIDAPQTLNDIAMGKREQRIGRDGLANAIDFIWTPGFNLGMMHEGLDRMDNRIIKGIFAYAKDAFTNPDSYYAGKKQEIAKAILGANSLDRHLNSEWEIIKYGVAQLLHRKNISSPNFKPLLTQEISLADVNQKIADHRAEVTRMSPEQQRAERKQLAERVYTLNWQKEVAELIEMAREELLNTPRIN